MSVDTTGIKGSRPGSNVFSQKGGDQVSHLNN
jgi:hypothetical protein